MRKLLNILIFMIFCANTYAATPADLQNQFNIQRSIDSQYKDNLRRQEMENRTRFKKETSEPSAPSVKPSRQKKQFRAVNVRRPDNSGVSQGSINKILAEYKDLNLGMNEIADIQHKLQNLYIAKGFAAARIYIDGNTIPDNILTFVVSEGCIEDIVFKKNGKKYGSFANALQKFSFYPFAQGELLNIKDLDQGLEQVNRLYTSSAVMEIHPGTIDGYSIVEVNNQMENRFVITLGADNSGLENTGVYKANASISSDNLLMLNDNIYFNYSRNIDGNWDNKSNNMYFTSLSIPFGHFTFMGSYFKSDYMTPAGVTIGNYTSDGSTLNKNASLEMVIKRGQNHKYSAGAEMALKETQNFYMGDKIDISSKKLTVASAFLTSTYFFNTSMLYGKFSYNKGLDAFEATTSEDPKGQFYSLSLYAQYTQPFTLPFLKLPTSYTVALNAQQSPDTLYSSEQITLGGQSSVRGFGEGSINGDSGGYLRNDLNWALSNIFKRKGFFNILSRTTLNGFIDYGYARHEGYGSDYQIAGAGAGLSYRIKHFNALVNWSNSVYNESPLKSEYNVIYFSIEGKIFF